MEVMFEKPPSSWRGYSRLGKDSALKMARDSWSFGWVVSEEAHQRRAVDGFVGKSRESRNIENSSEARGLEAVGSTGPDS
jgi:hypothetical protein